MFLEAHFSGRDTSKPITTENCGLTFPPFAAARTLSQDGPRKSDFKGRCPGYAIALPFTNQDGVVKSKRTILKNPTDK